MLFDWWFSKAALARPQKWLRLTPFLVAISLMLLLITASHIYAAPNALFWPFIRLQAVAGDFHLPVNVVSPNDGTDRLFVVERGGRVYVIEDGERLDHDFLDISDRVSDCPECGLLGLAFPPDFAEKGYFFVNYTSIEDFVPPDTGDDEPDYVGDTVIARFHLTDDPNVAESDEEEQILVINQPAGNHNGGHILFGPDNYLYIGMGDGGGSGDTFQNAQDPASLHGKILRISVSETATYTIPADNPFINVAGYRPEIWAMGLRNPWRFHFDGDTGDLYIADVGQENFEEVNHVAAADIHNGGMNFGWPILEGNVCYPPNGPQECNRFGLTLPVTTYTHDEGCSITGGHRYQSQQPFQSAAYLYADFCTGKVWGLQADGDMWQSFLIRDFDFMISTFGEDAAGNLYLMDYAPEKSTLYRVLGPTNIERLPTLAKDE